MIHDNEISLFITGDFCLRGRGKALLEQGGAGTIVDLSPFKETDYRITNLEAPLTDGGKESIKSGPSLYNPVASIHALKEYGFNLLCLANNHIMDYGAAGLQSTLSLCKAHGMAVIGAGEDTDAASKPYIIEKGGYKLAILNMAEAEFGEAEPSRPGFFAYDPITAYNAIAALKNMVNDVLVIFHGGHEYYPLPSPEMQKRYRFLIDAGASAVVAHHTHCISGHEAYRDGLIFYSLGNFIFDHLAKQTDSWSRGFAVQLHFGQQKKIRYELHPFSQFAEQPSVEFFGGEKKTAFHNEIEELNRIIQSPDLLQERWHGHLKKLGKKYLTYIEVPNNKYLRGARFYRMLPGWLTKHHKALILNLIRCDSHREVMKAALDESIASD